jgi:hypothetical protein
MATKRVKDTRAKDTMAKDIKDRTTKAPNLGSKEASSNRERTNPSSPASKEARSRTSLASSNRERTNSLGIKTRRSRVRLNTNSLGIKAPRRPNTNSLGIKASRPNTKAGRPRPPSTHTQRSRSRFAERLC